MALVAAMMLVATAAPAFADSYDGKRVGNKEVRGNKLELNKNHTVKTYDGKCDGPPGLCNG